MDRSFQTTRTPFAPSSSVQCNLSNDLPEGHHVQPFHKVSDSDIANASTETTLVNSMSLKQSQHDSCGSIRSTSSAFMPVHSIIPSNTPTHHHHQQPCSLNPALPVFQKFPSDGEMHDRAVFPASEPSNLPSNCMDIETDSPTHQHTFSPASAAEATASCPRAISASPTEQNFSALFCELSSSEPIPSSLPSSVGQLGCPDDEHVTVWDPSTGKTVAGNAAPYRRNLKSWLDTHQGWEEKADALKSSKRRSAALRARTAAERFASLCVFPVACTLVRHATGTLERNHMSEIAFVNPSSWSNDDFIRLQSALFDLAQQVHRRGGKLEHVPHDAWSKIASSFKPAKDLPAVILTSRELLRCGVKRRAETVAASSPGRSVDSVMYSAQGTCSSLPVSNVMSRGNSHNDTGSLENIGAGDSSAMSDMPHVSKAISCVVFVRPDDCHVDANTRDEAAMARGRTGRPVSAPIPTAAGTIFRADAHQSPGEDMSREDPCMFKTNPNVEVTDSPQTLRPVSVSDFSILPRSLPTVDAVSHFMDRVYGSSREPRITVWDPSTGRTISGNAAPCRKNLQLWLDQHPGWKAKNDGIASNSRRARKIPGVASGQISASYDQAAAPFSSSVCSPRVEAMPFADGSATIHEAVEGLLGLGQSQDVQVDVQADQGSTAVSNDISTVSNGHATLSSVSSQSSRLSNDDASKKNLPCDGDCDMVDASAEQNDDCRMVD